MLTLVQTLLSDDERAILDAVEAARLATGADAYLVGGALRDALMGIPIGDLDFTVVGDAIAFARALQSAHGGSLTVHEKFRTATWAHRNMHTDFTTARSEEYPQPAMLPIVTPTGMPDDLRRRDFTIDAMALRLRDSALLDPYDGHGDARNRLLRALHPRSFVDDPTRLLRGARYTARFGLAVEPQTRAWMDAGLPHVNALSGERVKYDLELIFDETAPETALNHLSEWGFFGALGIAVPPPDALTQRFTRARERLGSDEWNLAAMPFTAANIRRAMGWAALLYHMGQMSASRWLELIPFTADIRDALLALGALSTLSAATFNAPASQQSALLHAFSGLALLLEWLFESDAHKRSALHAEWHIWRPLQLHTSGDDLRARGLPPGPRYSELLARLRAAWLDGEVHNADEERALLDQILR